MEKSQYAQTLNETQKVLSPFFRENGFRKQGRSYNRQRAADIIHVINFQMGQYPISKIEIPIVNREKGICNEPAIQEK